MKTKCQECGLPLESANMEGVHDYTFCIRAKLNTAESRIRRAVETLKGNHGGVNFDLDCPGCYALQILEGDDE